MRGECTGVHAAPRYDRRAAEADSLWLCDRTCCCLGSLPCSSLPSPRNLPAPLGLSSLPLPVPLRLLLLVPSLPRSLAVHSRSRCLLSLLALSCAEFARTRTRTLPHSRTRARVHAPTHQRAPTHSDADRAAWTARPLPHPGKGTHSNRTSRPQPRVWNNATEAPGRIGRAAARHHRTSRWTQLSRRIMQTAI
jgi:hypothetical protein